MQPVHNHLPYLQELLQLAQQETVQPLLALGPEQQVEQEQPLELVQEQEQE
jgi:hypothetical protein